MLDDFRTEQPPYDTKVVWTHYALFSLPTDGNYNITTVKHDQADYPREYAILGERFVFPYGKNYPGRSYKVVHTNKPLYAIPEKQKISELQGKMGEAECIGVALFFKEELSEEERERFESDEFFGYERYQIIEEQDLRGNPLKKISQAEHHDVYYDLQIGEYSLSDTPDIFSGDDPEVRRPKLMERVYEEYNHQLIQFGKDHARMIWMAFLTKEKYTAGLEDDISDYKRNPYFIEYLNQTAEWIKPEDAKKQLQLEEEGDKNES
jgi:hypothetical protein